MLQAEWRLTLLAVAALPLFTFPAKRVARILRRIADQQMERNAAMSAILQETFNISGALLVKLFGRARTESDRYGVEAAAVRDLGVRSAMVGRWFFAMIGLVGGNRQRCRVLGGRLPGDPGSAHRWHCRDVYGARGPALRTVELA